MTNPALTQAPVKRLLSLDVLRGITIAFMIMVNNNGGDGAWGFMKHAQWNGLTPTDLVFPTFVFVVGASVVFAFEARLARGATRLELASHTVQRAFVLFMLGIVVNGFPFFGLNMVGWATLGGVLIAPAIVAAAGAVWAARRRRAGDGWRVAFAAFFVFVAGDAMVTEQRIFGVLQRIAVAYLAVGLFYLWDNRFWTKVVALTAVLAGYWALLRYCPIPGVGTPGRDFPFMDVKLNLVSWIDRGVSPHHLYLDWGGPEVHNVRDPEGLLSDLPAIGTALMGMLAALWLRTGRTVSEKAKGLGAGSVVCLILGYLWSLEFPLNKSAHALEFFQRHSYLWSLEFPLNKNLWTSSFVLVAGGWSLTVLTLAYWTVEKWGWGKERARWAVFPWLVFGSNAIAAYMFSELVPGIIYNIHFSDAGKKTDALGWVTRHVYANLPDPGWAAFAFSASFCAFCFVPVWILYRKKIFVKV